MHNQEDNRGSGRSAADEFFELIDRTSSTESTAIALAAMFGIIHEKEKRLQFLTEGFETNGQT